jgi:hypothetical protein
VEIAEDGAQALALGCWLIPWLEIFRMPSLQKSLGQLVTRMQGFQSYAPI